MKALVGGFTGWMKMTGQDVRLRKVDGVLTLIAGGMVLLTVVITIGVWS